MSYLNQKEIANRMRNLGFGPDQSLRLAEGIDNGHLTEEDAVEQFGDYAIGNPCRFIDVK